jgi:hypothetical protein
MRNGNNRSSRLLFQDVRHKSNAREPTRNKQRAIGNGHGLNLPENPSGTYLIHAVILSVLLRPLYLSGDPEPRTVWRAVE